MNEQTKDTERYFWISLGTALLTNLLIFQGSRLLTKGRFHYDLTLPADSAIPFMPWTICIYLGCFFFWFYLYRLVSRLPRQEADRFFCANLLGKGVSFIVFVLFPTTMPRPELGGGTVWIALMRILYVIDAPDNLFPSMHCMIAWLCWVGIRRNRRVPLSWQIAALLMAVAVCLSTLTIRQHVLMDVVGGILLSELSYWLAGSKKLLRSYSSFIDRLMTGARKIEETHMI
jgi:membrane-associated phospholipid phosphatase